MNYPQKHYKKDNQKRRPPRQQVIIGKTHDNQSVKAGFVLAYGITQKQFLVQSPFKIVNKKSQPSLFLNTMNTQSQPDKMSAVETMMINLTKKVPGVINYQSDGQQIMIDSIYKNFYFEEDIEGIIQFGVSYSGKSPLDKSPAIIGIFKNPQDQPIQYEASEETKFDAKKLIVFPAVIDNPDIVKYYSIMTCIVDKFEKVLFLPIIDKSEGLIGIKTINPERQRMILTFENHIRSIWPELELKLDISKNNTECKIYSMTIKQYKDDLFNNSIVKFQKVLGAFDMMAETVGILEEPEK